MLPISWMQQYNNHLHPEKAHNDKPLHRSFIWCTYGAALTKSLIYSLRQWGLAMLCGVINLGKYWIRWWLGGWQHQAITLSIVDLSPVESSPEGSFTSEICWRVSVSKIVLKIVQIDFCYVVISVSSAHHIHSLHSCYTAVILSHIIWMSTLFFSWCGE